LGLKSAQAGFWVARSELYDSEQKILNSALEAYLTLCEHREKYKIAEDSLKFSMEQTKMAEEKRKVGEATVTEVELVKSNLANAEANKAAQYAKLLGAEANFKALTGLDPDDNIAFPELPKDLPENFESFQNQVLKSNLDLLRAKYSVKQTKAVAQSAAAGLLPTANVSLSAGKNLPSQDGLRPQANTMTYETSLGINIPIYSQGGQQYSAIREGKKQARRAVYSLDYAEKAIKAQTINVWQNFTATKSSIAFADQAVLSQSLALDGTRQEYNLGVKTTLDVLKTQEDFNKARTQAVDIKKSYVMNAYNMKQLMGHMTASQLKLPVKYFVPEQEFRRIKYKVIGF
jgi:outer membrane protein